MEGSESEAIFESFDIKPQLFINEILNHMDDLFDGAFDYFLLEASRILKIDDGTDRSEDLKMGISYIRHTVQGTFDDRLSMWEKYCLGHCFSVPHGFSLPSATEISGDFPMELDDDIDEQVDAQLDVLRKKLAEADRECAELNQELQALEKRSAMNNQCASSVNDALQLYETSSAHDIFQEMLKVASELRLKMKQLKSKQKDETAQNLMDYDTDRCLPESKNFSKGLHSLKLDELQCFATDMNL